MKKLIGAICLVSLLGMSWLFAAVYRYGKPFDNANKNDAGANVVVQFAFEDAGPDLVDFVTGLTLNPVGSAITYRVDTSDYSKKMMYGTKIGVPGVSSYFRKQGAVSQMDLGVNDAVFEITYKAYTDLTPHGFTLIETLNAGSNSGYRLAAAGNTDTVEMTIWAVDGSVVQARCIIPEFFDVGNHKFKLALDRSGNQSMRLDGVDATNCTGLSMANIAGKNVVANNFYLGARLSGVFIAPIVWNELRVTVGNATNNSGGIGE